MSAEAAIQRLGLVLNPNLVPKASYIAYVIEGRYLYLCGQAGRDMDGRCTTGKVGRDVDVEQAYLDCRQVGVNLMAVARTALGSLDRVDRVIRILGFVNATPEFTGHARVIDGCSNLLIEVFGERGRHVRSAVGAGSLPNNITCEAEAVFLIKEDAAA